MGWDVAIWGSLRLPAGAGNALRNTVVDGSRWKDWKLWFANAPGGPPRTVGQQLAAWKRFSDKGHEFIDVALGPEALDVSAFVAKETFVDEGEAHRIAATLRTAEVVGATGRITFAGVATPLTFRLTFRGKNKRSGFEELDEDLETTPEMMRILDTMTERLGNKAAGRAAPNPKKTAGKTSPKPKKTASKSAAKRAAGAAKDAGTPATSLPADAKAALDEVYARLAKASDDALWKAAAATDVPVLQNGQLVAITQAFSTPSRLREALRDAPDLPAEEADARRRAAVNVLARLDLAAAEPLAQRLAEKDVPLALRWGAALALAGATSDAAVDTLLGALSEPGTGKTVKGFGFASPLRRAAEHALGMSGRADVGERVLGMLTDDALKIRPGVTGDFVYANDREQDKQDFVRAILHVLGRLRYRPAWERLAKVVQSYPLWEVRGMASGALMLMAEPSEIRGAFGEEPEAFFAKNYVLGSFNLASAEKQGKKLVSWVRKHGKKG